MGCIFFFLPDARRTCPCCRGMTAQPVSRWLEKLDSYNIIDRGCYDPISGKFNQSLPSDEVKSTRNGWRTYARSTGDVCCLIPRQGYASFPNDSPVNVDSAKIEAYCVQHHAHVDLVVLCYAVYYASRVNVKPLPVQILIYHFLSELELHSNYQRILDDHLQHGVMNQLVHISPQFWGMNLTHVGHQSRWIKYLHNFTHQTLLKDICGIIVNYFLPHGTKHSSLNRILNDRCV